MKLSCIFLHMIQNSSFNMSLQIKYSNRSELFGNSINTSSPQFYHYLHTKPLQKSSSLFSSPPQSYYSDIFQNHYSSQKSLFIVATHRALFIKKNTIHTEIACGVYYSSFHAIFTRGTIHHSILPR